MKKSIIIFFIVFTAVGRAQDYPCSFMNIGDLEFNYSSQELYKPTSDGPDNSFVLSENIITTESKPTVKYTIQLSAEEKAFGWADNVNNQSDGVKNFDFGFYLKNSGLYIAEGGKIKGYFGKVKNGMDLAIGISNGKISYLKQGKPIYFSNSAIPANMRVAAYVHDQNATLNSITSNVNHNYFLDLVAELDITTSAGALEIAGVGKVPSIEEYFWGEEFLTQTQFQQELDSLDQEFIDMLGPTPYETVYDKDQIRKSFSSPKRQKIHFIDSDGSVKSQELICSYPLTLENTIGVIQNDRQLNADQNQAKCSIEGFTYSDESGWISFEASATSDGVIVGYTDYDNTTNSYYFEGGVELMAGHIYSVVNNKFSVDLGEYENGDLIEVEYENLTFNYFKNGINIGSSLLGNDVDFMQVKVTMNTDKSFVKKLHHAYKPVQFKGCKPEIKIEHLECDGSGSGSISASFKGNDLSYCDSPFTFILSKTGNDFANYQVSQATIATFSGLAPGEYILRIINSNNEEVYMNTFDIGYKHDWIEEFSAYSPNVPMDNYNNLYYWGAPSSGYGSGKLFNETSGWIEYQIDLVDLSNVKSADFNWGYQDETFFTLRFLKVFGTANSELIIQNATEYSNTDLTDAVTVKFVKEENSNSIVFDYLGTEIESDIPITSALKAFSRLNKLNIINTASSYPCSYDLPLYAEMERSVNGELHQMDVSKVNVIYNEPYSVSSISKLELLTDEETVNILSGVDSVQRGDNRWQIDLTAFGSFSEGQICTLRLTNLKNEVYYLRVQLQLL